jgi:hypothetical protein
LTTQTFVQQLRRRLAELVTVFLGVALAFLAENWREELADRRDERVAVAGLLADFRRNAATLEGLRLAQGRLVTSAAALQATLADTQDQTMVSVPDTLLIAMIGGAGGYRPVRGAVDALISSGRLEVISSAELRQAIAAWPTDISDAAQLFEWEVEFAQDALAYGLEANIPVDQLVRNVLPWLFGGMSQEALSRSETVRNTAALRFHLEGKLLMARGHYQALSDLALAEANIIDLLQMAAP